MILYYNYILYKLHIHHKVRIDITVNNYLAVENTRLLATYCDIDPRLRGLVLLVKHWAKRRSLNDAYRQVQGPCLALRLLGHLDR